MNFSQILGKNRGCGLYSGATYSPENTVFYFQWRVHWKYEHWMNPESRAQHLSEYFTENNIFICFFSEATNWKQNFMACISVNCSLKICTSAQSFSEPFTENSTNHFKADRQLATRSKQYDIPIQGASNLRNADCGKLSRGNLRKIKCGTFRKLPLVTFPHSVGEKFRLSADRRKTTVRSHCTTDVQPIHRSIRRPAVPSFCILCGPFATEQGSFFTISEVQSLFNIPSVTSFRWSVWLASNCAISATVAGTITRIKHSCDTQRTLSRDSGSHSCSCDRSPWRSCRVNIV